MKSATPAVAEDLGVKAGRGGLAVSAAKLYFIVAGLIQQIALKAVLGLDGYGALSTALSAASIAYNPVVGASLQGVSHAVATAPESERGPALRRVLRVHAALALGLGIGFFLFAPLLGRLTGAPHLVSGLQILSSVMALYGIYAPLVGALNGLSRFTAQAAFDALAATLRTLGLIGGAWWWGRSANGELGGMEGACLGFAASSLLVLLVAHARVGSGKAGSGGPRLARYLRFIGPVLLGQGVLNLLFQADQLLLRRFGAEAALSAGLAPNAVDPLVGAYRAAQLFCFLPYQLVLSISTVLFPLVAKAWVTRERENVRAYVRQGTRTALLITGMIVAVTAGLPGPLLRLVFGADAAALAAPAMGLLALGLGCLALLGVFTSLLNSLAQQTLGLVVTALAFVLVVGLCFARVRGLPLGPGQLWQTALCTSLGMLGATLCAGFFVWRAVGAAVDLAPALRILVALAAAIFVGRQLGSLSALLTLAGSLGVALCYLLVLTLLGELGVKDLRLLQKLLPGRRS